LSGDTPWAGRWDEDGHRVILDEFPTKVLDERISTMADSPSIDGTEFLGKHLDSRSQAATPLFGCSRRTPLARKSGATARWTFDAEPQMAAAIRRS